MDELISRIIRAGAEDGWYRFSCGITPRCSTPAGVSCSILPRDQRHRYPRRQKKRNRVAGGVPDLALDGDTLVVRMGECKLEAALTDHQPVEYIRELASIFQQTGAAARLLFLVPEARREE